MSKLMQSFVALVLLALFPPLFANTDDVPDEVKLVAAPEVRRLVEDDAVLLVHVLSQIEYKLQHIPGSINIPVDQIEHSPAMPVDKGTPIIFYCNGKACPYSKRASQKAVEMGYTKVYWFRGGIREWRKYQYDMTIDKELNGIEVAKLRPEIFREKAQGNVLVIDVRPRWWRQSKEQSGVIEGTDMMIPLIDLHKHLGKLSREQPILLVDRLMRQTVPAAKYLKAEGFNVVGVLKGGAKHWVAEGLPVLSRADEPPIVGAD